MYKTCNSCGAEKPLDDEHFHKDVGSDDGFRNVCKVCRNEQQAVERDAQADAAFKRLEERGIQQLQVIAEGGSRVPHAAEVYEAIMEAFGGPRLFGQQMAACFFHPGTSQAVKAKLLMGVVGLARGVSDSGVIARDLDSYSDEDLRHLLQDRLGKAVRDKFQELRVAPGTNPMLIPGFTEAPDARVG
jgi:hypothetical protein